MLLNSPVSATFCWVGSCLRPSCLKKQFIICCDFLGWLMTFLAGCTWTISCDGIQLRHSLGLGSTGTFSPQHASSLRGLVWAELPLRVATVSRKGKPPAQEQLIRYLLATHLLIPSDWDRSLAKSRAGELIPQGCVSGRFDSLSSIGETACNSLSSGPDTSHPFLMQNMLTP